MLNSKDAVRKQKQKKKKRKNISEKLASKLKKKQFYVKKILFSLQQKPHWSAFFLFSTKQFQTTNQTKEKEKEKKISITDCIRPNCFSLPSFFKKLIELFWLCNNNISNLKLPNL